MKITTALTIAFLFISSLVHAAIRYVTVSGAGLMNGTSWLNAYPGTSLQFAINSSGSGDEVWVRFGTYLTTNTADRNIWFSMRNNVAIYGSFNGTETTLSQRSFTCGYSSVLSAEIGVAGNADNSYHVISNASLNTTAVIDGFTIRDANADFDLLGNDNRSLGGGMLNNGPNGGVCTPTIRNCLFTNNTALFGGGIFDHGQNAGNASPVITNCIFMNNTATGGGGAIDNFGYNGNASPTITNSIFYGNTATDRAGAIYCWGGGNGNASPVILNSVFVNNSSVLGGCIIADRSNFAPGNSGTANPTVRNCIFWNNTATTGPQFYIIGGANFFATYTVIDVSNQTSPHTISGPGTGNITTAPSFLNMGNPAGADNCWLTTDDGLQLQLGSAGIDAGDNTGAPAFDIRNYARVSNGIIDVGPYEFNSTALPVTGLIATGEHRNQANIIRWNTNTEINSLRFEIERSSDGIVFEKIGELSAAGNSSLPRQYQFGDNSPVSTTSYYRVRQVDRDGRSFTSNIIFIKNANSISIYAFPNPILESTTVYFPVNMLNEEFILISSNGATVNKFRVSGRSLIINFKGLASGQYLLLNKKHDINIKLLKAAR